MAQEIQEVRVFVASPSDVSHLRQIVFEEIEEVNQLLDVQGDRIVAKRVAWEDLSPGVGVDSQDVINQQIADNFDVFVGLLWHRFGTPTDRAESGTEEEFNRALDIYRRWPNRIRILTYRCNSGPDDLGHLDTTQLARLNEFVKHLEAAGVLYFGFTDNDDFRKHLRRDLIKALKTFGSAWGVEKAVSHQRLSGRLLELHDAIGGPFRSSVLLQSLRDKVEAAGIECLERLLTRSRRELIETGFDDETIDEVEKQLAQYGQSLRADDAPLAPLDQLALTPACRNAVRQLGVKSPDELALQSWNDLMRSGYFLPVWIEEISLRMQQELGLSLSTSEEAHLSYSDVLGRK